jgi:hypothetical protein
MSSLENSAPVAAREVRRYLSDVDDLLLDLPWQHRRKLIAGLSEHLRENPEQIRAESPGEYAAELHETTPATTAGALSGLRSVSWPTPLQWWESVVRGASLMFLAWVAYDFLAAWTQPIFGDPSAASSSDMLDSAFGSIYPVPTLHGSERYGLLVFTLLSMLVGQLTTGLVLSRAPHLRARLRLLTWVSILVIIGLLGYGAAAAG